MDNKPINLPLTPTQIGIVLQSLANTISTTSELAQSIQSFTELTLHARSAAQNPQEPSIEPSVDDAVKEPIAPTEETFSKKTIVAKEQKNKIKPDI